MAAPMRRHVLAAEFAILFLAGPLIMAYALPPAWIWPALAAIAMVGVGLLILTPSFRWRSLINRQNLPPAWFFLGWALAFFVTILILTLWLRPYNLFQLPRYQPELWIVILFFYPFVSALPQELVYRVLFFARYGSLFRNTAAMFAINAGCFALAHLFYGNWPAVLLSGVGGIIFAWAYHRRQSFLTAWLLHALAGQILFTCGLGILFYHGAVQG